MTRYKVLKNFIDKKGGSARVTSRRIDIEYRRNRITNEERELLIEYQGLQLQPIDKHQYKVIKKKTGKGDYTNPILWLPYDEVESGKWYYTEEIGKDLPRECILSGVTRVFDDKEHFEWIE